MYSFNMQYSKRSSQKPHGTSCMKNVTITDYVGCDTTSPVGWHAIFSMDVGSQQGIFFLVGGNKICLQADVGGGKKTKIRIDKIIHDFQWKWSFCRKNV